MEQYFRSVIQFDTVEGLVSDNNRRGSIDLILRNRSFLFVNRNSVTINNEIKIRMIYYWYNVQLFRTKTPPMARKARD